VVRDVKTILLKFAGPLQSWGTSSRFESRSTDRYPSKSAVVGILAACFGYRRDDSRIVQFNELDFGVRIDQPGELLHDYHVAQKLKPNGTLDQVYVTNRYYIQDAVFVVAIGSEDDEWISSIEYALRRPCFQPFLGRRCNPLTADFYIGTKNKTVMSCLMELEWQASGWYKKRYKGRVTLPVYADAHLIEDSPRHMARDRVITFSQKERLHGYRAVGRKDIVLLPSARQDHDAFNAF